MFSADPVFANFSFPPINSQTRRTLKLELEAKDAN